MKAKTKSLQSIRDKIIKRLTLSFLAMTVLIYLVLNSIMLNKINLLEERYAREHVMRVEKAIQHDEHNMADILTDWAIWDDTYDYIHSHDEQYVKANLGYNTFSDLDLDLMAFIDEEGHYIYAGESDQADKNNKGINDVSSSFVDYIANSPILKNQDPSYRLQGIIMVENRPMVIAVSPILKTDGEGPIRGHIIIGTYIDEDKISALSEQLDVGLELKLLENQKSFNESVSQSDEAPVEVNLLSESEIAGYFIVDDIYGQPVLQMEVKTDRSIHTIGQNAIRITLLVLVGLFFVFLVIILSFLDHSVLRRLGKLSGEIRTIGSKKEFSRRLKPPAADDELTAVAKDINAMLDALEGAQNQIKHNEEQLKIANENLQHEIGERKQAQEDIKYVAYHDYLTELPNRVLGTKLLNRAVDRAGETEGILAVLFLDIDGFKLVNDSMGHVVGDRLLKEVAARLQKTLRVTDVVARFGGDEFIVLLEDIKNAAGVEQIADKIVRCFRSSFSLNDQDVFVTTSIGIAIYPHDGKTADALIKNADIAMYKAKESGKNQHAFCTQSMRNAINKTQELSNLLYGAIERNELEVYYQPQVSCRTNEVVGMEALVRWNHPALGLILPHEFIPLAERSGLIFPIGSWILQQVCEQSRRWQRAGYPAVRMAVNISLHQFKKQDLLVMVEQILYENGLVPSNLELEISESIVLRQKNAIVDIMEDFQRQGIHIVIDDFGTKYSSLVYLKHFPANKIKIDMSFVRGIGVNEKDEAIIKAIIVLAKSLHIKVIAEGVETEKQWNFLKKQECDEVQGYYFYRPMAAVQAGQLLADITAEKAKRNIE
jgi:diguanylate cyclase (GGDEF)-like protein